MNLPFFPLNEDQHVLKEARELAEDTVEQQDGDCPTPFLVDRTLVAPC